MRGGAQIRPTGLETHRPIGGARDFTGGHHPFLAISTPHDELSNFTGGLIHHHVGYGSDWSLGADHVGPIANHDALSLHEPA